MKICITLILSLHALLLYSGANHHKALLALDEAIATYTLFEKQKEEQVERVKEQLHHQTLLLEEQLAHYFTLYTLYESYNYDSAYHYASKAVALAETIGSGADKLKATEAVAFCHLSSGLFKEAFNLMATLSPEQMSRDQQIAYYQLMARMKFDLADYNRQEPFTQAYIQQGIAYCDSLLPLLPPESDLWYYTFALRQMKDKAYIESEQLFATLLQRPTIDLHLAAKASSCVGYIHLEQGAVDQAIPFLIAASIYDIHSATKETTALRNLSILLYEAGDLERALSYLTFALAEAQFYNARLRKLEIGSVLPIIEKSRYQLISAQRDKIAYLLLAMTLLAAAVLLGALYLWRNLQKLNSAKRHIQEQNETLLAVNQKLEDSNEIKELYIGNAFASDAASLEKLEAIYKTINLKIAASQAQDLRTIYKTADLKREREQLYANFDLTFLKLFPSFIEEYNKLFVTEEEPTSPTRLSAEMRIFALIRLGVTESDRIARFLNYSVNTINTYKTKAKNRSHLSNDQFEPRILQIHSVSNS